jgi:phosphoserine phosphatase RsbX
LPDLSEGAAGPLEWAVAAHTLAGERESGDLALVMPLGGRTLFAVVDGLGHGEEAAVPARLAIETLQAHARESVPELVHRCHRALLGTRGAVIALAVAGDDGALTWTGVGNVEAVLVRREPAGGSAREYAVVLGGVLGMRLPRLRPRETTLASGDELIFATDGISRSFVDDLVDGSPKRQAEHILRRHATGRDDALVLVGRYGGGSP